MQRQIRLLARAKINLSIDVLNKRSDGFHEVEMIMQSIDLADEITVTCTKAMQTDINITVKGFDIPVDQHNIMWKAVELIRDELKTKANVEIDIRKNIPTQAGLGGGSADGAAVLFAMQKLLNLSLNQSDLMRLGAKLGSDVPFMFSGGTALAQGRGEVISPIVPIIPMWAILIKPNFGISTARAYQQIGRASVMHPDIKKIKAQIEQGKTIEEISRFSGNVIEQAVSDEYPLIEELKQRLTQYGAKMTMLSGSGSTVFGLFDQHEEAQKASMQMVKQYNYWCRVVSSSHTGIEVI